MPRAQHHQPYVAVGALEHGIDRPRSAAHLGGRFAREHARTHVGERPVGAERHRFVRRQLDELSGTGVLALVERAQRGERGRDRDEVVDEMAGWEQRRVGGDAGLERDAAGRRQQRVGGDVLGERAVESERGDGDGDEMRMARREGTGVETAVGPIGEHRFGREEHVGVVEQRVEPLAVGVGGEVEHHAAASRRCAPPRRATRPSGSGRVGGPATHPAAPPSPPRRRGRRGSGRSARRVRSCSRRRGARREEDGQPWPHSLQHGGAPVEPRPFPCRGPENPSTVRKIISVDSTGGLHGSNTLGRGRAAARSERVAGGAGHPEPRGHLPHRSRGRGRGPAAAARGAARAARARPHLRHQHRPRRLRPPGARRLVRCRRDVERADGRVPAPHPDRPRARAGHQPREVRRAQEAGRDRARARGRPRAREHHARRA